MIPQALHQDPSLIRRDEQDANPLIGQRNRGRGRRGRLADAASADKEEKTRRAAQQSTEK